MKMEAGRWYDMILDLIIEGARIRTGDPDRPTASRVGVWNGIIVGLDEALDGMRSHRVVNANGATLLPGFNDVHAHSVWFGQTLMELNLADATTAQELLDLVTERAATMEPNEWVIASNYNPLGLTDRAPTRDELDAAAGSRPLWIKHASGHSYTFNGVGLSRIGVADVPTEQVEGGVIVVDESGRATGVLEENAMQIAQRVLQPETLTSIEDALALATEHYASEGLTSVTDAGIAGGWIGHSPREFAAYQSARENGRLVTRMQPMITLDALHEIQGHADDPQAFTLDAGFRTGAGDEWLQIGPVKVFTDGSLLGGTAAMSENYECTHNHGYLLGDPDELREQVIQAAAGGWSLALHAIGDRAVDFAIDTIAAANERYGKPRIPNRIEHGGVVQKEQIARLAQHDIALVPQPHFISVFGDGMIDRIGPERTKLSYPAASLLEAGVTLPGSSDRPVAPGAPLRIIQAFVERLTQTGVEYGPEERLTAEQAIDAYTRGSAAATGWLDRKGTIEPGKLADFVLLGDDPTRVASSAISEIEIVATVIGGTLVYGSLDEQ